LDAADQPNSDDTAEAPPGVEDAIASIIRQLEPQDWTTLFGGILPPEFLQAEMEEALDEAERFFHGGGDAVSGRVSLVDVKRRLRGVEATDAYASMLAPKPECTPVQFEAALGLPISCRPPPDLMPGALDNFRRMAEMAAEQMPDEIDLLEGWRVLDGPEGSADSLAEVRARIAWVEMLAHRSPLLPGALAVLILVCAVRSVRGLLFWWGVPCLVVGGVGIMAAGSFLAFRALMMSSLTSADMPPDVPIALFEAVLGVLTALMQIVLLPALGISMVLGVGGLVAVVIAVATRPKTATPPPPLPRLTEAPAGFR
jgi:hypothetical protein